MKKYRINKLDIEGFRIYSRKQSLNIFENLTVVYGRNGRGKTTLQDAVDWLFNNNIARYIPYKEEWNRARNTHIRSLINPDIETQITGYFKEVSSNKIQKIIRNEAGVYDSGALIDSLFDSSINRDDLLWAHSLSQAKLQELALANGRDRLENLAPLLDNKVKELDDQLKNERSQFTDLENRLNKISEKDQTGLLENFRSKITEIEKTMDTIITLPLRPNNNMSVLSEVDEWRKWLKNVLNKITERKGTVNGFINQIRKQNINLNSERQENETAKSVEELEKELKLTLQKEYNRKKQIEQLENSLNNMDEEIQVLRTLFSKLNVEKDNQEQMFKEKES